MTTADDPHDPKPLPENVDSLPRPFWRGIGVGGLMALMVPLAMHLSVFSLGRQYNMKFRAFDQRPLYFTPGLVSELVLLFLSGVLIAIYRRATLREAVLQWCVPPALLIVVWTLMLARKEELAAGFTRVVTGFSFVSFLVWLQIERKRTQIAWPRDWVSDSILMGFVNAGMILFVMAPFCCCLPGLMFQPR